MDLDALQEMLWSMGYDDWEIIDDATILTPNGHTIEWDGVSPDNEVSPLIMIGAI
jgi:hypothetical protein